MREKLIFQNKYVKIFDMSASNLQYVMHAIYQ